MAFNIRRIDYFYTTVKDQPGEAYKVLSLLASLGINPVAARKLTAYSPLDSLLFLPVQSQDSAI